MSQLFDKIFHQVFINLPSTSDSELVRVEPSMKTNDFVRRTVRSTRLFSHEECFVEPLINFQCCCFWDRHLEKRKKVGKEGGLIIYVMTSSHKHQLTPPFTLTERKRLQSSTFIHSWKIQLQMFSYCKYSSRIIMTLRQNVWGRYPTIQRSYS